MPVPDPPREQERSGRRAGDRAGRRQHHRASPAPTPDQEQLVFLSGRIPRTLRDELHIRAIHEGRPAVELLREALRRYLDDPPEPAH